MEARTPFAGGRLAVRRRAPRILAGFSSGCRGRSLGLGGSVPPYGGIPFGDLPTGLGHNTGRARTGSPVVVPDSFALGQLSKPLGAQLSNPWTVTGSGRLFLSWVQEEPPSLRTEREGGQGSSRLFCPSPARPFRSDGGAVCRAHSCASLSRWVSAKLQEEPPSLSHGARERSEVPWLLVRPSRVRV